MNDYEKFVPVEVRQLVGAFVDQARANLEKYGYVTPVAFVGRFDGRVAICAGLNRMPKDDAVRCVREAAKRDDADFVLWVDEAWLKEIKAESTTEAQRIRAEIGGEVRDMAGRIDIVMFHLTTHVGLFVAHVERMPLEREPGKYTFGMASFEMAGQAEGRFIGLLPPRGAKQS